MELIEPSLGKAEFEAGNVLEMQMKSHGMLTMAMYNGMSNAMDMIPEMKLGDVPQALKVAIALLIRITNDLRSASLLALRGYPTQATTLIASLYEAALTVAYIGKDDTIAQAWIDHDDPTRPFMPIRDLTEKVLSALGLEDLEGRVSTLYLTYRQLCMAKHSNPLYQMQHSYKRGQGGVQGVNGPDTSNDAIHAAWFSMEHGTRLCLMATSSLIDNFVPAEHQNRLRKELKDIGRSCDELSIVAAKRFGSRDPYPGRWRT